MFDIVLTILIEGRIKLMTDPSKRKKTNLRISFYF